MAGKKSYFIDFSLASKPDKLQILAQAYVGRLISTDTEDIVDSANKLNLIYDTQTTKFQIVRPACQFDKNIYNSMVLASVVLLIFFIGMQIIEHEETKLDLFKKQELSAQHQLSEAPDAAVRSQSTAFIFPKFQASKNLHLQ